MEEETAYALMFAKTEIICPDFGGMVEDEWLIRGDHIAEITRANPDSISCRGDCGSRCLIPRHGAVLMKSDKGNTIVLRLHRKDDLYAE